MKTATAVGTCGSTTAQKVLSSPMLSNSRNCGTISTCPGIMMPASTNQKTTFLYRKCICDRAYAAMLAVMTVRTAVIVAMMKVATYHRRMSVSCSVLVNAAKVGFSMSHVVFVVSAFGFSAVSSAQSRGINHRAANAIRTPRQIRLNSFVRVSTWPGVTPPRVRTPGRSAVVVATSGLPFLGADDREPDRRDGQHDDEEQ